MHLWAFAGWLEHVVVVADASASAASSDGRSSLLGYSYPVDLSGFDPLVAVETAAAAVVAAVSAVVFGAFSADHLTSGVVGDLPLTGCSDSFADLELLMEWGSFAVVVAAAAAAWPFAAAFAVADYQAGVRHQAAGLALVWPVAD